MSVEWIEHKGKRILYVDYSGMQEEEGIKNLETQADLMRTLTESVLVLANYQGTYATPTFMKYVQTLGREVIEPKTKKGALIGITGIKKLLLNTYNMVTGGSLKAFPDRESALEYLVS
jgi:hypothetical protein